MVWEMNKVLTQVHVGKINLVDSIVRMNALSKNAEFFGLTVKFFPQ